MGVDTGDWVEFWDSHLLLRAPAYLRQQKSTMIFKAPKERKHGQNLELLGVVVITNESILQASIDGIENFHSRSEPEWGRELRLVRRGRTNDGGCELLTQMRIFAINKIWNHFVVLSKLGSLTLDAQFMGDGDVAEFETVARAVVASIRAVTPEEAARPRKRTRSDPVGLKRAEKLILNRALEEMPAQLQYLKSTILGIARQDQDLLGAGEANMRPIERAVRKAAAVNGAELADLAIDHADALHQWLIARADANAAWAAPAWFVEGALRGCAMFGGNQ